MLTLATAALLSYSLPHTTRAHHLQHKPLHTRTTPQPIAHLTPPRPPSSVVSRDPSATTATLTNEYAATQDQPPSYANQHRELFALGDPLPTSKPLPKPSNDANGRDAAATRVFNSDVYATLMRPPLARRWSATDFGRLGIFATVHIVGLLAPFRYFSYPRLAAAFLLYVATGMGITFSYHRQLAHRSFASPKWLEYTAAYCGMMAFQGAPLEWVSDHRYHHLHTETPLDPHSSYEGFWWSHLGWMLDSEAYLRRCDDRRNVADLAKQPFYAHMQCHYLAHTAAHFGLCLAVGGLPFFCWRMAAVALLYHVTWFVNSAAHLWGAREYETGDQSRNSWWVGFLAFGEGWHNNHHAFEYSARHGLRPRQFDITWMLIRALERLGLVWSVKLPSEAAKARLRLPRPATA